MKGRSRFIFKDASILPSLITLHTFVLSFVCHSTLKHILNFFDF